MQMLKSKVPRTDPCDTLDVISSQDLYTGLFLYWCLHDVGRGDL